MSIGNIYHSDFISSLYDLNTQTGYGFIQLPYQNTILYFSEYPFVMVNENHVFESLQEMYNYFSLNPIEKADGTITVIKNNGESFYVCESGEFKLSHETKNRIKHLNSVEIWANTEELNFYINDNEKSIFHINANEVDGMTFKDIYKIRLINDTGTEIAFRGFSF